MKPRISHSHSDPLPAHSGKARIAFYSHDAMGLGHLRRNLLIAGVLSRAPFHADVLLISGAREACHFAMMQGVDCVTLPAIHKDKEGTYSSKYLRSDCQQTTTLRSKIIAASIETFDPHLFVVDKVPRGIDFELDESLQRIRNGGTTRCVLGLREILDDPETVAQQWSDSDAEATIREYYDEVWIYGDPSVYDSVSNYSFRRSTAEKVSFTGYLDQRLRQPRLNIDGFDHSNDQPRLVTCVVGGGQDGANLALAFVDSTLPNRMNAVLITGPFMPAADRKRLREFAVDKPGLTVIEDVVDADHFLARSDRVVSMGGYNTVSAILSYCKPALVVPRMFPRREQWIRANALDQRGALTMLEPCDLTPQAITEWLRSPNIASPLNASIDLGGLDRIVDRVGRLLSSGFPRPCHAPEASFV